MLSYQQIEDYLKLNKKKWLITGVAGFIGSNILERLLILNQIVYGIDNLETGNKDNLKNAIARASKISGKTEKEISLNFRFYKIDIRNYEKLSKIFFNFDHVLHQSALGSVPRSIKYPIDFNHTNLTGFLNILNLSKEKKVGTFVYASSSSCYGNSSEIPKKESVIGEPLNPYALTKIVNEMYASVYYKNYGISSVGLRYFNIFGRRQSMHGSYAAVIPCWINSIINKKKVYINGDGETSRDFCYIENCIQANILASINFNSEFKNEILNISGGEEISLNLLFELIKKEIQLIKNIKILKPEYREFREGDIRRSLGDITKAKEIINFSPAVNVYDGISLLVRELF